MSDGRRACSVIILILAAWCAVGCEAPGQRLLHVRVVWEGRTLLVTDFGQSDSATRTEAWRTLADRELELADEKTEIPADPNDPLRATLKGKVTIVFEHAGSRFVGADVLDLTIERDSPTSNSWRIRKEELRRAAPF